MALKQIIEKSTGKPLVWGTPEDYPQYFDANLYEQVGTPCPKNNIWQNGQYVLSQAAVDMENRVKNKATAERLLAECCEKRQRHLEQKQHIALFPGVPPLSTTMTDLEIEECFQYCEALRTTRDGNNPNPI